MPYREPTLREPRRDPLEVWALYFDATLDRGARRIAGLGRWARVVAVLLTGVAVGCLVSWVTGS